MFVIEPLAIVMSLIDIRMNHQRANLPTDFQARAALVVCWFLVDLQRFTPVELSTLEEPFSRRDTNITELLNSLVKSNDIM
ncbi:hypothetical protein T265_00006 [Opisthorchis viverrini]|uniref:Uncharacterized protein n=1 Tax=Opisthorchis viverrini TaxID=6198 RepID=A0A075A429_OPIVI|nr:hypothetical protein T265_00006 [Opisthorchis viverrini]KER34116.1 hypothetical protein T265_00006 [Opisthorchis viverrini]